MLNRIIPIALACLSVQAQTPAPTFEAASIKTAIPLGPLGMRFVQDGGPGTSDPGLFTCQNCSLFQLVLEAYGIESPSNFSGPPWLQSTRFDVSAKIPDGATKPAFQSMLQNLLAARFRLTVHRENREMPAYELTVAKNGPKFKEASPKDAPATDAPQEKIKADSEGYPILPPGMFMAIIPGHARLRSENRPIEWFAHMLTNQLGSPVTDATGLPGKYDFVLSWVIEEPGGDPTGPTLADAVQSELGLKLQQKKGPVEILVVDHIEKAPTAN